MLSDGGLGLLMTGIWVSALIEAITTDSLLLRNLTKVTWAQPDQGDLGAT